MALESSLFLILFSWSLSLSAALTGVTEAWKTHGGFRAKVRSAMLHFYLHSIGQNSVSWFLVGTGK